MLQQTELFDLGTAYYLGIGGITVLLGTWQVLEVYEFVFDSKVKKN